MADKKAQGVISIDGEPAINSLEQVADKAKQTGAAVAQAGTQGAAGMGKLSEAAEQAGQQAGRATEKTTSAQRALAAAVASSVRQAQQAQAELAAGSRGTVEYFAELQKIQGVSASNKTIENLGKLRSATAEVERLSEARKKEADANGLASKALAEYEQKLDAAIAKQRQIRDDLKFAAAGGTQSADYLRSMAAGVDGSEKLEGRLAAYTAIRREIQAINDATAAGEIASKGKEAANLIKAAEYTRWWAESLEVAEQKSRDLAAAQDLIFKGQQAAGAIKAAEYVDWWAQAMERAEFASRELAAAQDVASKGTQAAGLIKAAEYADWWAQALSRAELAERELLEANAIRAKSDEAAKLVKAGEYVNWWTEQLRRAEVAERQAAADMDAFSTAIARASTEAKKAISDYREMTQGAQTASQRLASMADTLPGGRAAYADAIAGLKQMEAAAEHAKNSMRELNEQAALKAKADAFIADLTKASNAIGKTRADLLELRAAELGVAEAAAPMIAALRAEEAQMNKMGNASKEMAWAMRSLPMQFTDVVVSLQGGIPPLQVLIQQGGQLKDMFGGIGPAAKAMGGYIVGLVTPVNLAIAAALGLGVAYVNVSKNIEAANRAFILTNGMSGVTADNMRKITDSVAGLSGVTFGTAGDVIRQLAGVAGIGAENMQKFASAALEFERVGGGSAKEVAKSFADLAKTPLDASLKLNEASGYLTVEIYKQIQALEKKGEKIEAAKLAWDAYYKAIKEQTPQLEGALLPWEQAWNRIKEAAAFAANEMARARGYTTNTEKLVELRARLAKENASFGGMTPSLQNLNQGRHAKAIAEIQAEINAIEGAAKAQEAKAGASAREQEQLADFRARERLAEEAKKKAEQEAKELVKATFDAEISGARGAAKARTAGLETELAILEARRKAELVDGPAFYLKKRELILSIADAKAAELEAENRLLAAQKLSGAEAIKRDQKVAENRRQAAALRGQGETSAEIFKLDDQAEAKKLMDEYAKSEEAWLKSQYNAVRGIREKTKGLEDEREAMKLSVDQHISLKEAIEKVNAKRLEERRDALMADGYTDQAKAIQEEIDARLALGEMETWKAGVEESKKAANEAEKEWKKTANSINSALTDALMRAFDSGKGFADALKQFLIDSFKNAVLKPTISAVIKPFSDSVTGLVTGASSKKEAKDASESGGSSGALSSLASMMGMSGYSAFLKNGATMAMTGGTLEGLQSSLAMMKGGEFAAGATQALGVAGPWMAAASLGRGVGQMLSGGYSITGGSGNSMVNTGMVIGAVVGGPIGAAIGAAIGGGINRLFGRKLTETGIEGTFSAEGFSGNAYQYYKGGTFRSNKTTRSALDEGVSAGLSQAAEQAYATVWSYADAVGLSADEIADYTKSFRVNLKGLSEEDAAAKLEEELNKFKEGLSQEYKAQLDTMRHLGEDYFDALERLFNLQEWSENINSLGGVFSRVARLSVDAREDLIAMAGSMETLATNAQGFVQNYYSAEEIAGVKAADIIAAMAEVGITGNLTSADDFRALVEGLDVSTESGREQLVALLAIQGDFADVAEYMATAGQSLAEVAQSAPDSGVLASIFDSDGAQAQLDAINNVNLNIVQVVNRLDTLINVTQNSAGVFEVTG